MLRDEHGMPAIGRLPAVLMGLRRREALRDNVVRVLPHRRRAAHHRDRSIATARREVKLRAEPLCADRIEAAIEGGEVHARS